MKLRGPLFISLVAVTFLIAAFLPQTADDTKKESVLIKTILTFADQLHFSPKDINDEFSQELYTFYLDRLDGARRFLTQKDVEKLEVYRNQLDEQAKAGTYEFFDLSLELLNQGIDKAQGYYVEVLDQPFNYELEEDFELDGDKRGFARDDQQLKEYWRKLAKYETLTRLERRLDRQQEKAQEEPHKSIEELEQEARADVEEMFDDYFKRIQRLDRSDRITGYLNTISQLFDPHTSYFEPVQKESFDIDMSGQLEGIGARLTIDGDYTKVSDIIPGGPAWKGKELQENDLIIKVGQGEDGEWQDVTGWMLDDVVSLIRGEKGTKVRLAIRKVDGTREDITIVRDLVQIEDTYAKSLTLQEDGEKFGYIYLPRFYINFDDPDGRSCSKDIAREIEKLNEEGVSGIILDLRDNGGGSLSEVVKMSGFFIEEGPVVQVKARRRAPEIYRDEDKKVLYDGPLAIMVNHFSASASEILAAALQDYERAVIVGSNSTYGKGTVQRFFDMDRVVRGQEDIKPLGEIKLTTQKFYRIDGGTTQLKGVRPDIVLPDAYQYIEIGEKELDYALPWTEIDPVKHKQNVYEVRNTSELAERSAERIANHEIFQKVIQNAQNLSDRRDESTYPLQLRAFQQFTDQREEEAARYNNIFREIVNPDVANLKDDLVKINSNEEYRARNTEFVENVSKDIYIDETVNILRDMITEN